MNVISASRRTDLPAFYWPWFMNRIRAGYCHWVNPFRADQVFRVSMGPEDIAGIVFWTRDARPMLPEIARLREAGYAFYVHYTINGYSRELEHHSPAAPKAVETLRALSDAIGPHRVIWRYDPVILGSATSPAYHFRQFEALAEKLGGAVRSVYISFCDPYNKTRRHFKEISERLGWEFEFGPAQRHREMAARMAEIASARGMQLYTCAEPGLEVTGVEAGRCIDPDLLAELRPDLDFHLKTTPTRPGCGCVQSVDIGGCDTCVFGCEYCYANHNLDLPRRRTQEHDPEDSILWRPPSLRGVNLDGPGVSSEPKPAPIMRRQGRND